MDLLVFFNPGFLWHACPGEFNTCDSEGPRAWLESASVWRPDAAQTEFSLVIFSAEGQEQGVGSQDGDVLKGLGSESTQLLLAVTVTVGQG